MSIVVLVGVTLGSDDGFVIAKLFLMSFTLGSDIVSVANLFFIVGKEGILSAVLNIFDNSNNVLCVVSHDCRFGVTCDGGFKRIDTMLLLA